MCARASFDRARAFCCTDVTVQTALPALSLQPLRIITIRHGRRARLAEHVVEVDEYFVEVDEHSVEVDEDSVEVDEHSVEVDEHSVEVDEHSVEVDEHCVGFARLNSRRVCRG